MPHSMLAVNDSGVSGREMEGRWEFSEAFNAGPMGEKYVISWVDPLGRPDARADAILTKGDTVTHVVEVKRRRMDADKFRDNYNGWLILDVSKVDALVSAGEVVGTDLMVALVLDDAVVLKQITRGHGAELIDGVVHKDVRRTQVSETDSTKEESVVYLIDMSRGIWLSKSGRGDAEGS